MDPLNSKCPCMIPTCSTGTSRRGWITVSLFTIALGLSFAISVGAQSQPPDWYDENAYTFDPHGLISLLPWMSVYGSGTDTWEVWICWTPGESVANIHDPKRLTKWLNDESDVIPYFRWLSGNRYRPTFRVGGTVEPDVSSLTFSEYSRYTSDQSVQWSDCVDHVKEASPGGADGALIIDTSSSEEGWAGPSEWCLADDCASFPGNDRWAIVGGDAFADTYVHEIGHALHWPHSFSRAASWEYDNPMDVMGSPTNDGKREWRATPAVNRYAAGWVDPDDVAIWFSAKGVVKFRIDPIGVRTGGGKQMVAMTYTEDGVFDALGARVRGGYDLDIPREGVEVYRVDQRAELCDNELACVSLNRRVWQRGAADTADHVLGPGEALSIPIIYSDGTPGARVVTVKRRVGDSFDVVIGPPFGGAFRDDDGSVHEVNIEALAQESITRGCDADLDLFCPHRPVTRAQLVVMLVRATDGDTSLPAATGNVYSDVAADAWYARHVERFAGQAWTNPQGTFRPNDPAKRGEVAEFIAQLLPTVPKASTAAGRFTDVPADHPYLLAIEALAAADVTKGCDTDPPRFCPDKHVTRAQLASLLIRALTTVGTGPGIPTATDTAPLGSPTIAVGSFHSCAIRSGGTIACWGSDQSGRLDAPTGTFTAVSAGDNHTCAILSSDRSVICWGGGLLTGKLVAPPGTFDAVATGGSHACGIRTDGTAACWGNNDSGQATAPTGTFKALSATSDHTCGIRTDGTAECWGINNNGQAEAPTGRFTAIAAGSGYSCGIRGIHTEGNLVCWGGNDLHRRNEPRDGRFTAIATGFVHTCAIRTDGTIACWVYDSSRIEAPPGRFIAIAAGGEGSCAIRTDGTSVCWGEPNASRDPWHNRDWGQVDPPSGHYTDIAAGDSHSCAIGPDGSVTCWGDNRQGQTDAPSGRFEQIVSGSRADHSCAIRVDWEVVCWGSNARGQLDSPPGRFTTIAVGAARTCGIHADGSLVCWPDHPDIPSGQFTSVAVGRGHFCGVRTNGSIFCWGSNDRGQADPPKTITG